MFPNLIAALEASMKWRARQALLFIPLITGCATFGQKPAPVGEPGPIACVSSEAAWRAWMELDKYMRQVLEAQQAYSCGPVAPAGLAPALAPPVVPPLR